MDAGELIVLCEQVMFVLLRSLGEKVTLGVTLFYIL